MSELCRFCLQITEDPEALHIQQVEELAWVEYWKLRYGSLQSNPRVSEGILKAALRRWTCRLKHMPEGKNENNYGEQQKTTPNIFPNLTASNLS
jgi:hypothetical protein